MLQKRTRLWRGVTLLLAGLALLGAGLAAYTSYAVARVEAQYPAIGKFADTSLGRLHYTDQGSGPAVVLLHGASSNLREFEHSLVPPLAQHFRVINIDRPGYGYSERNSKGWPTPADQARAVHELLAALNVKRATLVGHSLSGSVVMAYGLAYPEATRGVVSLAGGTHPWKSGVAWHVALASTPLVGELFANTLVFPAGELMSEAAVEYVFWPEQPPDDYRTLTALPLALRPDSFRVNARDVAGLSDFLAGQSGHYASLQVPVLLIHGSHDRVVPAWNHAARTIKQYPDASLVLLEGAGHGLHYSRTQAIVDALLAWMQTKA